MSLRKVLIALALSATLPACNPYNRTGDYYAGPVDSSRFPNVYRGTGASATANGTLTPFRGFVGGQPVGFFTFPVQGGATATRLRFQNAMGVEVNRPLAYAFDPQDTDPFPATPRCAKPADYVFDQQRDYVRFDEQGNIFAGPLPALTSMPGVMPQTFTYNPSVAEVKVTSSGSNPCNEPKSHETVVERSDVSMMLKPPDPKIPDSRATGIPSGKYLAWAIVAPEADVRFADGSVSSRSGLGPQKWGWFDHFLVAYIDGGYIPTRQVTVPGMMGAPDVIELHAVPQNLYVPRVVPAGSMTRPNTAPGSGYDVLAARRGTQGYSPLCKVLTFLPTDPMNPEQDAALINQATVMDTMTFTWCLQFEPQLPLVP